MMIIMYIIQMKIYKKFEKDINGIKLNEKEKIMELINK